MEPRPLATLCAVTLDCAAPLVLAAFYSRATGSALVEGSTDEFAGLRDPSGLFLGFQRVDEYRPPTWPVPERSQQDVPQQVHLDLEVDDLDAAEQALTAAGATRAQGQPDVERYRVLLDPAGHPFCLTTSRTVRAAPTS